jgi:hypothetical protein
MIKPQTIFLIVSIAVLGIITTACPERKSIAEIEAHPGKYQGKEIAVAGIVKDSYGVSIPGTRIGGGAYKIDDGTGAIWVVVSDGNVPQKGSEIGIKGVVQNGANWKGKNYGLGIYEKDRRYKTK